MHFIAAIILILIVLTARLANKLSLPLILISLVLGILFGSDVLGLVYFDDATFAKQIADTALLFILFVGGFGTKKENLKLVLAPALILASLGVAITAILTGVSLSIFLNYSFPIAFLIGAIIASTDASAVFSILRTRSLPVKLTALTEIESATNDPMAILLTTFMIQLLTSKVLSPIQTGLSFFWQLSGGILIGILIGKIGCFLFVRTKANDKGYFYILIFGIVLLSFGLADLLGASGMLSAFFAGYVMGNSTFPFKRNVKTFLDALSTIGNVTIFVLLGLLVFPSEFSSIWFQGIVLFVILTFIARPVTVFLLTMFTRTSKKERLFLSWGGLRGAVPVVLATYPAAANMPNANNIFNIVFFAVTLSIIVQGLSLGKFAEILKLTVKAKPKPDQVMELVTIHESELELYELHIDNEKYFGNATISSFNLPSDTTISMINRKERIIAPKGSTVVFPGDILFILTHSQNVENVLAEILSHYTT